jgi:hypothetical protein
MKRTIIVAVLMSLLLAMFPVGMALAATSAEVTVTATPGSFIGISCDQTSYDFGDISANSTPDTTTGWATITNSSSVVIDITIGSDGWSGTTAWTYGASGADTAQLNASATFGGSAGSSGAGAYDVTIPSGSTALLCDDLAVGNNPAWEMQLDAPSSFTHGYTQTTHVTLTAAAGG